MDYNDNKFDLVSLFTDKKYRSRMILVLYLILFIVLIFLIRGKGPVNSSNNKKDDVKENLTNENQNKWKEETNNLFSLIDSKNYNFRYVIETNNNEFVAEGKRFDNKYDFIFSDGSSNIHYLSLGNVTKAKTENPDSTYQFTNLPSYYISFFDKDILKSIFDNSIISSNSNYIISNEKLRKFIDKNFYYKVGNLTDSSNIAVELKNNHIVSIKIDLSNFIIGDNITHLVIYLSYSNFNLVDDFDVNFNE